MRDTFVIVNPRSRQGEGMEEEIRRRLPGALVRRTQRPHQGRVMARWAASAGYRQVVAAGGDGTLNDVVNGIAPWLGRVRLGVLPLGTGNDFARSIGVPADLDAAAAVLSAGVTRRCDVVSYRDRRLRRLFLNVSAGGFSGEVGNRMGHELKQSWGPLAYLRAAIDTLPERTEYRLSLRFDGHDEVHESAYNLAIANGRFVAGGLPIAPTATLDDGRFDVLVVRPCPLSVIAGLASRAILGRHLDDPRILFRRAHTLEVRASPLLPLNVDGELLGERAGRYEMLPGALEVVVGADAPAFTAQPPEAGRAGAATELRLAGGGEGGDGGAPGSPGGSRLPGWRWRRSS
jgi:diacylglycerol kinase (ATP)